jgi:hypothetical protein
MLSAEQATAQLTEVQRLIAELQLGAAGQAQTITTMAATNAQTLATMQSALAANAATLANVQANMGDGGRDRGDRGNNETRINHTAAKGLAPREWIGEKDPVSFSEFSAEFMNYACAMNAGAKHLLDQAARNLEPIDIMLDLRQEPFIDGLAEILDVEFYRQLFKVTKGESRIIVQNAGHGV